MNKKRNLLLLLIVLTGSVIAIAKPAYPGKQKVTLKDGRQVNLTLRGDEHFSFFTDDDGNTYKRFHGQGIREISLDEIERSWVPKLSQANKARLAKRAGNSNGKLTGKKKGLVILMQFGDYSFVTENVKDYYQHHFNQTGFSDNGMTGSVSDYFKEQSYGQFELDFDVIGPFTASHSMVYYGGEEGDMHDRNPAELIEEACKAADAEVNFKDYDWDDSGEVDQVFVIFAGYGQNYDNTADGKFANCIWPHESHLSAWGIKLKLDGVTINTYACDSELSGTSGTKNEGIGGACHEFSHCLGLPDFYDTQGTNFGMGRWDVMDQGNYNNESRTPAGYTSYERMFAGWLTPIELNTMTRVEGMKPIAEMPEAYIVYNEGNRNEYYLLENRQPVGFDAGLYGHGLLVLHVDYDEQSWSMNTVNVNSVHQRMAVIPADNALGYGATSYAGDVFPGTKNVTELTNYTNPAATLYNTNKDGTKLMGKPIDNIRESDDGLISFVACRPELGIPSIEEATGREDGNSFIVSWPAVEGALGYELELTETGGVPNTPEEALQREFTFDETISKSIGYSDISSKLADYGLTGWSGAKLFTTPNKLRIGTSAATGYIRTATWEVPSSSEMTVVIGADVVKANTTVKGTLQLAYGNEGERATYEKQPFEVTGNNRLVAHFAVRKDLFWLEIQPEAQMYLNYLALYDGNWTAEQLRLSENASARQGARQRAATDIKTFTTDTNSFTFTDLDASRRYFYRIRALGEENTRSQWSEERQFGLTNTSAIENIKKEDQQPQSVYDLQGRSIGSSKDALRKGIYIIDGKLVVR